MLVGKVIQLRGQTATLDADGNVTAELNRESHLMAGNAAQLIGRVNPDLSIKVLSSTDLGSGVGTFALPLARQRLTGGRRSEPCALRRRDHAHTEATLRLRRPRRRPLTGRGWPGPRPSRFARL